MQAIGRNTIRISKSPAQTRRERWRDLNGSPSRQEAPQSANFVAPGQAEIRNKLKIQKLQCPKQKAGVVKFDALVKSRRTSFRSWFDTCLRRGYGRQASPRTENQILTVYLIRSP
jgi:hypothetical protein